LLSLDLIWIWHLCWLRPIKTIRAIQWLGQEFLAKQYDSVNSYFVDLIFLSEQQTDQLSHESIEHTLHVSHIKLKLLQFIHINVLICQHCFDELDNCLDKPHMLTNIREYLMQIAVIVLPLRNFIPADCLHYQLFFPLRERIAQLRFKRLCLFLLCRLILKLHVKESVGVLGGRVGVLNGVISYMDHFELDVLDHLLALGILGDFLGCKFVFYFVVKLVLIL